MGFVFLAVFIGTWVAVVRTYGKRGVKGFRPHLLGLCGGIVGLFVFAMVASSLDKSSVPNTATSVPATTQTRQAKETVAARAIEIFDDYEANEVAADQKYKGKEIIIVGTVQSIDKDAFNAIVVHLQTRNQFMSVSATLQDKYESEAALMKRGDIVDFSCVGAGRVIGSPILKDCRPLPADPPSKKHKKT